MRISRVGRALTLLFMAGLVVGCGKTADEPRMMRMAGTAGALATAGSSGSPSTGGAAVMQPAGAGGAALATAGASSAGEGGAGANGVGLPSIVLLERGGGLGFCIPEDVFRSAKLELVANGDVMLSGKVHHGWDDTSMPACESNGCEIVEEVPPFALTQQQADTLGERIAELPPPTCAGTVNPICDPCLTARLTLDGTDYHDPECKNGLCEGYPEAFNAVTELIDSFVP